MEFKTAKKFDPQTFGRIKSRIKDFSVTKRELSKNPLYSYALPSEIDVQLTYACNLRCKMCYQWNDGGYFKSYNKEIQKKEIPLEIFESLLRETHHVKSRLYLWGGEPLYHTKWEAIASSIEKDPRYTIMCTNGILVEKKMDSLLKISPNLALLVSVDGLKEANNALRGRSTFERLTRQMQLILDEQRKGNYKGTVSVNVVLNDDLIPELYEFVEFFEEMGIDSIYFNYPWYISPERAKAMDIFFQENFQWLGHDFQTGNASWHSFSFRLSEDSNIILQDQIKRLNGRIWKIRVRFQQQLQIQDIQGFISDTYVPARKCHALSNRAEVLADGKIGTCCKFFPEFAMGDLNKQSLASIWKSKQFNELRGIVSKGLMPVCAKCILLYRNGI